MLKRLTPLLLILLLVACNGGPAVTNSQPSSAVIVCFGDSLTYGTGADGDNGYPVQLSRMLGRPVINAGIPGDTTAGALNRLETDVLAHQPGYVLLTLGANDLRHRMSPAETRRNLSRIVERIQAAGAMVIMGGIDIPLLGRDLNSVYRDVAKEQGALLIKNVLDDIIGKPELMSDQVHPNTQGYSIMAAYFAEALKPYL